MKKGKIFRQGVSCRSTKCKNYEDLIELLTVIETIPWHCQTCKRCWYDKFEPRQEVSCQK